MPDVAPLSTFIRRGVCERKTKETSVAITLNLDGSGHSQAKSGIGYLDHMLDQLAFHGLFDLDLQCTGDLHIDCHHSVEDIALSLGAAFSDALGDNKTIQRFGHSYTPMDETLARVVVDFSGRAECYFAATFNQPQLGQLDTQMIKHFFKSVALSARITLHAEVLYGENDHHKCEALFKGLGRALSMATRSEPRRESLASTKGVL